MGTDAPRTGVVDQVGRSTQPEHLHVKADLHVQVIFTRLEQTGVAAAAELAGLLLAEYRP
jgi:hypothetical protein